MKIYEFAVHRPKFTMMMVFIVIIIGYISFQRLPIDLMPDITYPTLNIMSSYANASPEEIEELVTRIIEEAMSAVPGVEEISSVSSEGSSRVRLSFSWGTDLEEASNDVRDRIDRIIRRLPENMDRPVLRKFDPASMPIVILGASGNLDPVQMRRIIEEQVKHRIERVDGVASLDIRGGLEREIQVNLYTDRVNALKMPLEQIMASIRANNITQPVGSIERGNFEAIIRTPGQYTDLEQIRNTVVGRFDRIPVRLRDIASVEDRAQKIRRIVRINQTPGVQLAITKQSGKNTVEVAESVLKEVERINRDIQQIELIPIIDSSEYIRQSISSVGSAAFFGGIFAVIVLLFFLRSISSTAIISIAIPVSIIAAFALMYFSGFTLNIMTLGGLALGIGMLVDNAIVVLENIYRLREEGFGAQKAAVKGCNEVTGAVIASTLTTVAVFFPLVFMEGMAGIMFKQLALVVSFALLCSLAVSLTVVPMLASRYLHHPDTRRENKETLTNLIFKFSNVMFIKLDNLYRNALHWVLFHRFIFLSGTVAVLVASLLMVPFIGVELMPQSDEGEVRVSGEMEVGTKLSVLDEQFQIIESVVAEEVPEMKSSVTSLGSGFWMSSGHTGQMRISLVPKGERSRSSEEIVAELRRKLSHIPGMTIRARAGTGMVSWMFRGMGGTERVQVEIRGHDLAVADELAILVKNSVEDVEGITDAQISRETGSPEELIIVDREKAADMNLTVSAIAQMLQIAVGGSTAGYFREGGNEYRIFVRLKDADNLELDDILNLRLTNPAGEAMTLRSVVDIKSHSGPVSIERKDQERIVTVSANTSDRDLNLILNDIRAKIGEIAVPNGFTIGFAGEYEQQQETFGELTGVFILALLLVYMVMVSLYESLRDPFVVMFSVPLAAIGVIWMLLISGTTFNMQTFIGCIMLGGIVVNNAIVLVDQTNLLRKRDKRPLCEAVEEAGRRRLRPILMTAFTTMLALVPMALGIGEGGELQAPLARAVIGGLFSASIITLFIVPVVYFIFEKPLEECKKSSLEKSIR